jgi:SAM-dependent methyltransferase
MAYWIRKVMNHRTTAMVGALDHPNMDAAEISGGRSRRFPWRSFERLDYPAFDICASAGADESYDYLALEQVLEHVQYPYRAVRNIYRMLRPGGFFLISLPFLQRIHNHPIDCSRWTPTGLGYFLEEAGFDRSEMTIESWGNRECIIANFESWVPYDRAIHPLHNEPKFPAMVWALAKKQSRAAQAG